MALQQRSPGIVSAIWPPILIALCGVPLALEWIAPNAFYGVRTAATLASPEVWYRSNFQAGVVAVIGGMAAALANIAIVRSSRFSSGQKWGYSLGMTILAAAAMAGAGLAAA